MVAEADNADATASVTAMLEVTKEEEWEPTTKMAESGDLVRQVANVLHGMDNLALKEELRVSHCIEMCNLRETSFCAVGQVEDGKYRRGTFMYEIPLKVLKHANQRTEPLYVSIGGNPIHPILPSRILNCVPSAGHLPVGSLFAPDPNDENGSIALVLCGSSQQMVMACKIHGWPRGKWAEVLQNAPFQNLGEFFRCLRVSLATQYPEATISFEKFFMGNSLKMVKRVAGFDMKTKQQCDTSKVRGTSRMELKKHLGSKLQGLGYEGDSLKHVVHFVNSWLAMMGVHDTNEKNADTIQSLLEQVRLQMPHQNPNVVF